MVQLGGRKVFGCLACGRCRQNQDNRCAHTDDEMNSMLEKMIEAAGIIITKKD
jgi:multimeric flavodoxin WrbA